MKANGQSNTFSCGSDWEDEADNFKEIFFPDLDQAEGRELLVQHLLKMEGFQVTSCERAETHPVMIIRLIRGGMKNFVNNADWTRHFQSILIRAGYRLRRDEITVGVTGRRILLAFQTGPAADVDAILSEPVREV
jgi:hypothetical protein